jgi:glycosyltransferase involved in cell wall biosynthesis
MAMLLCLEIGPLQESQYTGIANVVCHLAAQMLAEDQFEVRFFIERREVSRDLVKQLVQVKCGKEFAWIGKACALPPISVLSASPSVGIFGNVKTAHFLFDYELQIIHDLSTLVTPEFHHVDTVRYHTETLLRDLSTNDLNVCVSQATRNDLERYFPEIPAENNIVSYPGWSWPDHFASRSADLFGRHETEPYVLVLGTIEPRKNIDVVLRFIAANRSILDRYKFVFSGKHGWGDAVQAKLAQYDLTKEYENGRILFPGFVGEFTKFVMLSKAVLVVYPSWLEGFGLPVVEALSLGKAVVTTVSSSIPEVGGDAVYYFDPFEDNAFGVAISKGLYDVAAKPETVAARSRARAAIFSWRKFYSTIKDRVISDISAGKLGLSAP